MTAGRDKWTVWSSDRKKAKHFESRSDAEDRQEELANGLGMHTKLFPPGELPDEVETVSAREGGSEAVEKTPSPNGGETANGDGTGAVAAEIVDHSQTHDATHKPEYDLPDRSVAEDPLDWVPGDFIDTIDGTQAINRKGFEVLSHFYDVDVHADIEVPPEDTEFQHCRVKATAVTKDGRECEAYGTAHVERGDDSSILVEMADTRARKRALSIATGVGAVAVDELRNEVEQ